MDHQVFGSSATTDGFASLQPGIDLGHSPGPPQKGPSWPVSRGSGAYHNQTFNRFEAVLRFPLKSYARAQPNGEHPPQHNAFLEKYGPLLP
jgi:hypothetical protein